MTPIQWILGDDTGISSMTIWAAMMEELDAPTDCFDHDVPHDPPDFGRCYRLLQHFPSWRRQLHRVAVRFPYWGPMIREWRRLEDLYENGQRSALYEALKVFEKEGKEAYHAPAK